MCLRLLSALDCVDLKCPWLWCQSLPFHPSSHRQVKPQWWAIAWEKSKNCPTPRLQTCFSHVPEGKGRLQSRERRCALCRWTRRIPWPPPPRSPWRWRPLKMQQKVHYIHGQLKPIGRKSLTNHCRSLTTAATASSVRKFGRVTIPSLGEVRHRVCWFSLKIKWIRKCQ